MRSISSLALSFSNISSFMHKFSMGLRRWFRAWPCPYLPGPFMPHHVTLRKNAKVFLTWRNHLSLWSYESSLGREYTSRSFIFPLAGVNHKGGVTSSFPFHATSRRKRDNSFSSSWARGFGTGPCNVAEQDKIAFHFHLLPWMWTSFPLFP